MQVYGCLKGIQHWWWPRCCVLCGLVGQQDLCEACAADLPRTGSACERCAEALSATGVCGRCLREPPSFDRILAPLRYQAPLDLLIRQLKFRDKLHLARVLGEVLAKEWATAPRPDALVPVPLHAARLRERGFNQALELSRPLARHLRLPLLKRACRRVRATQTQSALPAQRRRGNVRGAFEAALPGHARHVAVVDDVVTTGHTVNEVARALKKAGAERVDVWCCARAQTDHRDH
ncbi:MAG TPA: ComF family protein [Gammaproteobacteria bacterium]|nr:ComF family protein [Gammaproteobacteria bacterium]